MTGWDAKRIAGAAGAEVVRAAPGAPRRVVIDSRAVEAGDLFVGLRGENDDGGRFASGALEAGAWGVLVGRQWAEVPGGGAVLAAEDPLRALQSLARERRRALGVPVIAITGSVGKTSTKDLCGALLRAAGKRVYASRANFNTEIGLPLEILAAPDDVEVLVLELAMRGAGQIGELAAICEPDVGVITNVGPVHVELLGSVEAVAAAKAELLPAVRVAIVPAADPLLEPHIPGDLDVIRVAGVDAAEFIGEEARVRIGDAELELPFTSAHMLLNTVFAYEAARAVGAAPAGRIEFTPSALRGERIRLPGGTLILNDCYNANPLSMRAALADLAAHDPQGRRIAVLGDMLELGPDEVALHEEIGAAAQAAGVDVLVTVGPLAANMRARFAGETHAVPDAAAAAAVARQVVRDGDAVLVKASRGIGLEAVAEALEGAG